MTLPANPDGVFISCVSDEFEKERAPFPGLRGQLRDYLIRTLGYGRRTAELADAEAALAPIRP